MLLILVGPCLPLAMFIPPHSPTRPSPAKPFQTFCDAVAHRLNDSCVVMLSQDSFYKNLSPEEIEQVQGEGGTEQGGAVGVQCKDKCFSSLL